MRFVEWVIKPSTFCNLRCRYCYEWNGLDDRRRMPLETWRKLVTAIVAYHQTMVAAGEVGVGTRVILHGGEPFALPVGYLEKILDELRSGARAGGIDTALTICVQTNLTVLTPRILDLIETYGLRVGVSMDVVPGMRLSIQGATTEALVMRNMDRLRERGLRFGAITVLARHTCPAIDAIFDFWAAHVVDMRFLPLFAGPAERDMAAFDVGEDALVGALCRLFDRWMASTAAIEVSPLDEWLTTVVRHRLGASAPAYDRRTQGESVWVVRPDGSLFMTNEVGNETRSLGSVAERRIEEVLRGAAYHASLRRSDALTTAVCTGCEFRRACDGYPAHTEAFEPRAGRRCPVTHRVYRHIDRHLERLALGEQELRALAGTAA